MPLDTTTTESEPVTEPVITITDAALDTILKLRGAEEAPDDLGLRIEITGTRGADFTYDLAFDPLAEADPGDTVYRIGELPVIVANGSADDLRGAVLDLPSNTAQGGLVLRNPNHPRTPALGEPIELTGTPEEKVRQLLDQQINPAIAAHGGFATLERIDGDAAVISMGGGCQGCALSAMTLRQGIETAILGAIPEIHSVVDITDHESGENPFYAG